MRIRALMVLIAVVAVLYGLAIGRRNRVLDARIATYEAARSSSLAIAERARICLREHGKGPPVCEFCRRRGASSIPGRNQAPAHFSAAAATWERHRDDAIARKGSWWPW